MGSLCGVGGAVEIVEGLGGGGGFAWIGGECWVGDGCSAAWCCKAAGGAGDERSCMRGTRGDGGL